MGLSARRFDGRKEISLAVVEYFLFVARRDLWKRHLLKTLNHPIRSTTRAVLETWQNPIVLLGKVTAVHEDYFLVDEVLGHASYSITSGPGMDAEVGLVVFGIVLPDNRRQENGVQLLEGLSFIRDPQGRLRRKSRRWRKLVVRRLAMISLKHI